MDEPTRRSAERVRALVEAGRADPALVREALAAVAPLDRDAWVDVALGLGEVPDDGPALPRGCTPYLPCAVDALLRAVDRAPIRAADVFVDVGAGVGRAALLVHLLTGARAIGLEIQPELVALAEAHAARLGASGLRMVLGDAAERVGEARDGTVFFLYTPFGGDRLARVLDALEPLARARPIRVCAVDLPLPPRPWLRLAASDGDLAIHASEPPWG